ncbi:stress-response A/B barrel domain-containing protein UP3-like [Prunus avium]|uniref:Stress-response A/B barrel domain-containing protein UP3-like n=1 Tax=Prunus avium TaxID=42229 RepID=A0A6P5RVF2_PRUAV|nr:stress-response A/B barrel domain-containing protein UP3-like [Prunus avium]
MSLTVKASGTLFSPQFSRTFSAPKLTLLRFSKPSPSRFTPKINMSSSAAAQPIVEHVVLFKVKDDTDPSKVNAMVNSLNGLASLNLTLHLTAGPLYRTRSSPIPFTHLLHSRYSTKDDLSTYTVHPNHLSVVKDSVLPICDDVMAVDWVPDDVQGPVAPPPGSAIRLTFLKLKENLGEESKSEILDVIKGIKGKFAEINQISAGENFSPARAKGYSIASLAVLPGVSELEGLDSKQELANVEKDRVREHLESVIVLDYVVASPQSASL